MADQKSSRVFAFDRVFVYVSPDGSKVIEWTLNSNFPIPVGTPEFYIEFAWSGGEWTRLNPDDPVTNMCVYVDQTHKRCGYDNNYYYRVVMAVGDEEYTSTPEPALGIWNRHDWLISRDVIRKEYLRLQRYVGAPGYLLKKRNHGTACTECIDWDTQDVVNDICPVCYGTAIVGGYYDAIMFYLDLSGTTSQRDVRIPFGEVDKRPRTARCVAYPTIETYDLWIDGERNKRYVIRQVERAVERRGKPLVYICQLEELPATDIAYSVPLEQDLSEYTGISPTDPESAGWHKEISYIEVT